MRQLLLLRILLLSVMIKQKHKRLNNCKHTYYRLNSRAGGFIARPVE